MRRLVIVLVAALAGCGRAEGPIIIGVAGPLQQANGRSMRLAAIMAAEEVNARGGVRGRRIELRFADDEANPAKAPLVAQQLRDDPRVVAVIGHINSAATLAAAPVYNDPERGVVAISPASSSPLISRAGPWTFRVCPTDLQHGPALAQWAIARLGRRRALFLYSNDNYGRGVMQSFRAAFAQRGGRVVSADPYLTTLLNGDSDIDPYLLRGQQRGFDVLLIAGQADGGIRIIREARRLGFTGPILGGDGLTNVKSDPAAEGVYISSAFLPDRPDPRAQAFVAAYRRRWGETPDHRGAMTYDAFHLIVRAIEEVGPERLAIRRYLEQVGRRRPPFLGVSGTIRFDENGDVVGKEVTIGVVRGGELVTAGTAQ